jgi:putative ATP-binding cassette transporter
VKPVRIIAAALLLTVAGLIGPQRGRGQEIRPDKPDVLTKEIETLMREGQIPGLSVVIIKDGRTTIKSFGYADPRTPVTPGTLFEIGSCSKAFTALAVMDLVARKKIDPEADVSAYLPWFRVTYKRQPAGIKVKQLLHQTSGIPWNTIGRIPASAESDALEKTVLQLKDQELDHLPGTEFEYATINYDVLALIIEKVTGQPFEKYLQENIIDRLGLDSTSVGTPAYPESMASGYKLSFFRPRKYIAPVYRGNYAAGYVISNATDMAKWLQFQLGLVESPLAACAVLTHQRDESVAPHDNISYASGWRVSLTGNQEIFHGGANPNFTSFVALRPGKKIAVAVLANSNSSYTPVIASHVMSLLAGEKIEQKGDPADHLDTILSIICLVLTAYLLIVCAFMTKVIAGIVSGKRRWDGFSPGKLKRIAAAVLRAAPYLCGLYLIPRAFAGSTWESMNVWTPGSFLVLAYLLTASIVSSCLAYCVTLFFPEPNEYKRLAPQIILTSILTGLSGVVVIVMVTSALDSNMELNYKIFYYSLVLGIYLLGRRFVQRGLIKITNGLMYDLRIGLIKNIFSTAYRRFEDLDKGKIYTTLNDDVSTIGSSTGMFVAVVTSVITVLGAFTYMATIAAWATVITICILGLLCGIGIYIAKKTRVYFEQARDVQNVFIRLIHGIVNGYKEIVLHRKKMLAYRKDVVECADAYRTKVSRADVRSLDSGLIGESLLVILLGFAAFGMKDLFPDIQTYHILSFIMVLLYLIGPVNAILASIPRFTQVMVSWHRIKDFSKATLVTEKPGPEVSAGVRAVNSFRVRGVEFKYKQDNEMENFGIGPIDLEVYAGQILFIIGGNGSGKTTLAKLLTGLYPPDKGEILINGRVTEGRELSEYFSTVFSPPYLFEKLYNVNTEDCKLLVDHYLSLLNLENKVTIDNSEYSTIDLSAGQRKRLALLQCYLEESPIYLFDEWAADQDPDYRRFFYRVLLPEMRKKGKIVIAITHDDHYFDVADKVLKMDQGTLQKFAVSGAQFHSHEGMVTYSKN